MTRERAPGVTAAAAAVALCILAPTGGAAQQPGGLGQDTLLFRAVIEEIRADVRERYGPEWSLRVDPRTMPADPERSGPGPEYEKLGPSDGRHARARRRVLERMGVETANLTAVTERCPLALSAVGKEDCPRQKFELVVAAIPYRGAPCGGIRGSRKGMFQRCDDPEREASVEAGRWTMRVFSTRVQPSGRSEHVDDYVLAKGPDGWEVVERYTYLDYP